MLLKGMGLDDELHQRAFRVFLEGSPQHQCMLDFVHSQLMETLVKGRKASTQQQQEKNYNFKGVEKHFFHTWMSACENLRSKSLYVY